MKKILFILAVVLLASCGQHKTASRGPADWIWVATTGDDVTGDGTAAHPYLTIAAGISHASAGDTVYIVAGTYNVGTQIVLPVGISLMGEGATSIISSTYNATNTGSINVQSAVGNPVDGNQSISYIKLDGNSLTARRGIYVYHRSNVAIHHVTVEDFLYNGIFFWESHDYWLEPAYPLMTGNSVRYCNITNSSRYDSGWFIGGGIYISMTDGFICEYNTFNDTERTAGTLGQSLKGAWNKRLKVRHNTFTRSNYNNPVFNFFFEHWNCMGDMEINDNTFHGLATVAPGGVFNSITSGCTYSVKIYDNEFLNAANGSHAIGDINTAITVEGNNWDEVYIFRNRIQRYGWGIAFTNPPSKTGTTWEQNWVRRDHYVYYNIIENIGFTDYLYGHGIIYVNGRQSDGYTVNTSGLNIYNNVITADTAYYGIMIRGVGSLKNVNIKNNIITGFTYQPVRFQLNTDPLAIDNCEVIYNNFYNGDADTVYVQAEITDTNFDVATGNITTNPLFKSNETFRLRSTSPAIDAGTDVDLTHDYWGHRITGTPDMGACEFGNYVLFYGGKQLY